MNVRNLIVSLISGIADPAVRFEIANTINFLFDVYCSGGNEKEIASDLFDICYQIVTLTHELTEEEAREKAEHFRDQFMKAFRLEGVRRRVFSKFRSGSPEERRVSLPF